MKHKFEEGTAVRIFDIIYTYGSSTTIYIYGCDGIILTYRGVPLGWGAGWAVTRKQGWGSWLRV